jgi:RNA polymerase sigma factor (sigma-70 family)
MDGSAQLQLAQLLRHPDAAHRVAAWDELIARNTRLLLAVARSFGGGHDEAMDRYAYILEKLREQDFRRLRSFEPDRGASFATWLTLASRRLCLDQLRTRYGRDRGTASEESLAARADRRSLAGLLAAQIDPDALPASESMSPDRATLTSERDATLRRILGQLTSRERLLLALRFQNGLPASRIAVIVGVPTAFHVYRQLNPLLLRIRASLEAQGIDGSDG